MARVSLLHRLRSAQPCVRSRQCHFYNCRQRRSALTRERLRRAKWMERTCGRRYIRHVKYLVKCRTCLVSVGKANGPQRRAAIKQNVRRSQHRKQEDTEREKQKNTKGTGKQSSWNGGGAQQHFSSVDIQEARKRSCHGYATNTTTKHTQRRNRKEREKEIDSYQSA